MADISLSPVGLALATATSVANVVTDVARKKVVDRNELVAGTFWIRVFAALVFGVAVGWLALMGSPPVIHSRGVLSPGDFKDFQSFAGRLMIPDNRVAAFLLSHFSEKYLAALADGAMTRCDPAMSPDDLLAALNGILQNGDAIYQDNRFANVTLSAETKALLQSQPRGETMTYLNRLLLEDAFPDEISQDHDCALFGTTAIKVAPLTAFLVYLAIDVTLIALAQILLMRALQISPMSLCIPFMAFSPVFLIPMGYLVLGELPTAAKLMGVGLIVIGSLLMHRKLFVTGWWAPLTAIFREKGSRFILLVAFILSITSPVEKQLVSMSDPLTVAFGYGLGLCIFFGALAWLRKADCAAVMRKTPGWAIVAGVLDGASILLLYFTFGFLPAVIAISIKRAGIVLAIFAGFLVFHERNITDKLIAACVMLAGVLFFYLPLDTGEAAALAVLVLVGLGVALFMTRLPAAPVPAAEPAGAKDVR